MKKLWLFVFVMSGLLGGLRAQDSILVYKFDIKEMIAPSAWRTTMKNIDRAVSMKADFILIHMNTYGGLVDAADSIRTKLLNCKIPVLAFVDNNAASAGALIAIACDSIYMRTGANIGAATVVNQEGAAMPDKYQSYMRATMRSTAEAHGKISRIIHGDTVEVWHRDPRIAEAMVDERIEIDSISEAGKVLTFTASEAMKNGYCEGIAENVDEVLKKAGISHYRIYEYEATWVDKLLSLLMNPALQGIFIMLMVGGIYFELQTPGIGFPLAAAVVGAMLYFAPLYLEGIANHWEILVFVLGIILIGLEVFVIPGFGITGISGIVLVVLGLSLSMVDAVSLHEMGTLNLAPLGNAMLLVLLSILIAVGLVFAFAPSLFRSKAFRNLVLVKAQTTTEGYLSVDAAEHDKVGKTAIVATDLRPSGKIELDGELFDAQSFGDYIPRGQKVIIVKFGQGQLYVKKQV
ncbi:MAG: hypothetical protein RIS47_2090 [Bacteroidota bacterium]|jgi:membrane-bound serine protease (ClpP class)